MDNAQKAIMIGVGLFITIIIISAVLLITNIGTDLINNSRDQLSSISKALQSQVTSAYDGKIMNGSEVISACTLYENSEMSIIVYVDANNVAYTGKYMLTVNDIDNISTDGPVPGGVLYDGDLNAHTDKVTLTELQQTAAAGGYGVNATNSYYTSVIKDSVTGTVIGIIFVQA